MWNYPGSNAIEAWAYSELTGDEKSAVQSLGINEAMWDCWMNHYGGHYWSNLKTLGVDHYWILLGWNSENWDGEDNEPETESMEWSELTEEQQAAAAQLCYSEYLWNEEVPLDEWRVSLTTTTSPSHSPSVSPTTSNPTTSNPTVSPTSQLYCPESYNMTKTDYTAGQRVEVDNYIFECRVDDDDIIDYAIYCNIALPYELTEEQQGLWNDAWVSISSCYRTETPTAAPSTLEPSGQPTKSPTG